MPRCTPARWPSGARAGWWLAAALVLTRCECVQGPGPGDGPAPCEDDADCRAGEICGDDDTCHPRPGCKGDEECLPDELCRVVDGTCRLRSGFGRECSADTDCYPGFFCALGRCRDSDQAWVCARATDCPLGMRCDRLHFYCIEEVPCDLEEHFPEITCDPDQICDPATGSCTFTGPRECTVEDQAETCGPDEICDAGGRCVQCITSDDCGPGLTCNVRAGRCESEDLCRTDADCTAPLVCDPSVALCRVPLPPCSSDLDCALSEFCNHVTGTCEPTAGKCFDDRLEENDSPAGAFLVTFEDGAALLDDLQLCPDDDDYFAVQLGSGDGLTARVQDAEPAARVEVELVAPDGVSTLRSADAPPRGDGTVSISATEGGVYYVRLLSRTTPSPYNLELTLAPSVPCADDTLEGTGGNDSPATAPLIEPGAYQALTLCDGDVDHYRVGLADGEGLRVRARGEGALDPDLTLVTVDGGEVLAAARTAGREEQLFYRSVEARAAVLRVTAFSGAPAGYTLEIEVLPPYSCAPDLYEAAPGNNAAALATPLAAAGVADATLSLCRDDEDWFRFELEDYQRLVAMARFEPGDIDLDLEAYLEEGATLVAASRAGAGVEALSFPAAGAPTTVWLRAVAADGAAAPYTLTAYLEHGLVCEVDPDEPNDLPTQASPAPASGAFALCGFDEDYYVLALTPGRQVLASITFSPYEGDLDLQLLHPDGLTPLATSDGITGEETLLYQAEVEGEHYLRVYSLTSDPHARYLLVVEVSDT